MFSSAIKTNILELNEPCREVEQDAVIPFTNRAYIFYWLIPYCHQTFDLQNKYHRSSYLYWLVCHGRDYGYDDTFEVNETNKFSILIKLDCFFVSFPKRAFLFWESYPEIKEKYDLKTLDGVGAFVRFLLFEQEIVRFHFSDSEKSFFVKGIIDNYPAHYAPISTLGVFVWLTRADLQQSYPIVHNWYNFFHWSQVAGGSAYETWFEKFLGKDFQSISMNPLLQEPQARLKFTPQASPIVLLKENNKELVDGVAIVGYAQSEIGTGEDSRTVARSLANVGFPVSVFPIIPDAQRPAVNHSVDDLVSYNLDKKVTIFNTPTIETMHLLMHRGQPFHSNGSYCIGYWAWELPQWRKELNFCFDYIDEVWASSKFIQNTFQKVTHKPVIHMPLPVILPEFKRFGREDFNLPLDKYLFLYNFDFNSSIHRKNPVALIEAFKKAFPNNSNVGLVIKTKCTYAENDLWKNILSEAGLDSRIFIFNGSFTVDKMYSLVDCIDCYVSPHRSEGFGRTIAEAMMLKKPTIVTNYSGNTDFCTEETSFLVDYKLVKVKEGEYPYSVGFDWADPIVDRIAEKMNYVYQNDLNVKKIIDTAYKNISENYSLEALGPVYKSRLEKIASQFRRIN